MRTQRTQRLIIKHEQGNTMPIKNRRYRVSMLERRQCLARTFTHLRQEQVLGEQRFQVQLLLHKALVALALAV